MMNYPNSQSFFSRSPTIEPLNSISSWSDLDWYDRDSYQQRQLKRLQALVPPVSPPPLQLGHLTPNQEYQLQRLRRLTVNQIEENQSIPTFQHWRAARASRQLNPLPPTTEVSVRRSLSASPQVIERPRKIRVRRPARRVARSYPRLRVFLNLMTRYGWAVCGATWMILIISGGLAGKVLINPEYATTYSASYESPASQIQSQPAENAWLSYSAIALGGAGVTWLISQCFKAD